MANAHIRFQDDDVSDYDPSDSEDDYTETEKKLLKNVRNKVNADSDSEDEVYGLGSEADSEDKSDIALSDVEGQDDDDNLPDIRAWGKNKKHFYNTDYVDPDYGGFQGEDAARAEREEEEANNLQKQFSQQLGDIDHIAFSVAAFGEKNEAEHNDLRKISKADVGTLSKRQKLQLLKRESSEFVDLIEDFKVKMTLAKDILKPVFTSKKKIGECEALDFIKFYYHLILNYCTNISMYLLLKASKVNLKNHPIAKRLFQYRHHLVQMESVFEEIIKPQIKILKFEEKESVCTEKKTLKLLAKFNDKRKEENATDDQPPQKKAKKEISEINNKENQKHKHVSCEIEEVRLHDKVSDNEEAEDEYINDDNEDTSTMNIGEKRAITYQIAKNKGLTPHRKREQRNPRVKHRNKFRKAQIRRKGAVREVRKEMSRYAGEISGIKASVTKSIKIKG